MTPKACSCGLPHVAVLYVDLDDTVRKGFSTTGRWVNAPSDVQVFPEAVDRLREWSGRGGRVIAVSNQGGIALGHMTREVAVQVMDETRRQVENLIDMTMLCPHHPDAATPEDQRCWCRKPRPGMLIEGAASLARICREAYPVSIALMVGDRDEDREAAHAANVDFLDAAAWRKGDDPRWLAALEQVAANPRRFFEEAKSCSVCGLRTEHACTFHPHEVPLCTSMACRESHELAAHSEGIDA